MTSPAVILAKALPKPRESEALRDLAKRAGVEHVSASRAAKGRPIAADAYLRLCAVVGIDPIGGKRIAPQVPGVFVRSQLGMASYMRRLQNKHALRTAAAIVGISYSSLYRLEHDEVVSIETVLAACRYVGMHPFDFIAVSVPDLRETLRSAA